MLTSILGKFYGSGSDMSDTRNERIKEPSMLIGTKKANFCIHAQLVTQQSSVVLKY